MFLVNSRFIVMKILFVSTRFNPFVTPINGDAQRTRLLLKACARITDVDVVSFTKIPSNVDVVEIEGARLIFGEEVKNHINNKKRKTEKWSALFNPSIEALFQINNGWETKLDSILSSEQYDLIVVRYFPRAISCGLWKYREKLVVDFDDALPFYFLNQISSNSSWSTRARMRIAAKKAVGISRRAVKNIHAAFFANEAVAVLNKGFYLPNLPIHQEGCPDSDMGACIKRMVFVGQLDYQPNKEGLNHFLECIYLPLKDRLPNVELHVVGKIKDKNLHNHWQSFPDVTVTGFVDDLVQEYEQSQVVVVPVYRCGATNIKLLEAMAMNRACVTTMEAFEKLNGRFESGKDLYASSNDAEFVEMLVRLLTDETENHRVAHNAKTVMDNYYSFDSFCEIVKNAIVQ